MAKAKTKAAKKRSAPKNQAAKRPVGRPSKYDPEKTPVQAAKLMELGATDQDLADFFGVSTVTIWHWKLKHEEFVNALKGVQREHADDRMERSLFHRGTGYTYDTEEVFVYKGKVIRVPVRKHVPPDTAAAIIWLKNRRPEQWRDRHDHVHHLDPEQAKARQEGINALLEQMRSMASAGVKMIDITPPVGAASAGAKR